MTNQWPDDDVILYDGVCVFCSRWVRFVASRDTERRFRFTAVQSGYGTRLAQAFGIDPGDPDTNAVIHGGVACFKSDAALTVLSALPGWGWARALRAVPQPLRDGVYNLADDCPASQNAVVETACGLLGQPLPPLVALDDAGLSPEAKAYYGECRRVANGRARRLLGWRPAYPDWRAGLRAIAARERR